MPPAKIKPSTARLSEVTKHLVIPEGIVTTGWPAVEARCLEFGDEFDEWQRGAGKVILGKRDDGLYAATVGGVGISIARQVAKTWLVGRIVFGLCCDFPGMQWIWSAHRVRTSTSTFQGLQGYCRRKKVAPFIEGIRKANGEQEIEFVNGSKIMFGARENGFGRGIPEIDGEVFDESQILGIRALEDMVAATNQSRHPHGALLFFMGTPPRPVDPGEAFTARRKEALSGDSTDAVWIEMGADEDANLDDRKQWAKANASFPHRTPLASMLRLRKNLPDDDSWRREALGIWDRDTGSKTKLPTAEWKSTGTAEFVPVEPGQCVIAFDCTKDGGWSSVVIAAGSLADPYVEVIEHKEGDDWLAAFLVEKVQTWKPTAVGCNGSGPAGAQVKTVLKAFADNQIDLDLFKQMSQVEYKQACGGFYADVKSGKLRHRSGQQPLDDAAADALDAAAGDAAEKTIGNSWEWDRIHATVPISPLVAVTVARALLPVTVEPEFWYA